MKRKTLFLLFSAAALALAASAPTAAQEATPKPWKIVSWSSSMGSQAATYEIMYGLKASLAFLNANGGINGRELALYALEMDDTSPDFNRNLEALVVQGKPDLVVGGACSYLGGNTAEYFRRVARPWFGPWSVDPEVFAGREDDPAGLLPTSPVQIAMLFARAKAQMQPGKTLYFIYREGPQASKLYSLASSAARAAGVDMKPLRLSNHFRNWEALKESFPGAGAVLLWTAPGPAAAIRRVLDASLGNEVIWMTHSLNPPGQELIGLTGGRWAGMIFPAVLKPSNEIPEAYSMVLAKYALPGLRVGYRSFLGFTQGQLLAKAIALAGDRSQNTPGGILRALKGLSTAGSLYQGSRLPDGPTDPAGAYLAVADNSGGWHRTQP
ncbi:MAG: ABC transporter substrate-binding protein [Deltaproteobacteria bacterium]|jgi:ABC-type branched-subunit amino acid transport system substrate-binding protein|nr:ABC transporter substrate-binding protein [Deltaproteobacteria bacterium]